MDHQVKETTVCSLQFFDCFAKNTQRLSVYQSVKRETNVVYQQPHLVEPMKLRVYEDLPATPVIPPPSHLEQWGRNLASRASSRASRISVKRRTTSKSIISRPQPIPEATDLPLRRRRSFSPLQLSIYANSSRLSDLPEFDSFSFTEDGELKLPPKALTRTQSETILRKHQLLTIETPKRTASMFETGDVTFARPGTSCSIISTSRPPSEYDALHSHPVSWASLPGIPAPKSQKADKAITVMTPMQEEFSPVATAVSVAGTVLNFPKNITAEVPVDTSPNLQAPYPTVCVGPSSAAQVKQKPARIATVQANSHKRISQWLQSRNTSTSTIGSVSTTASFAEHRRKRSEFYKLYQETHVPPVQVPQPLNFSKPQHIRTNTESTAETADTSILSSTFDHDSDSSRVSEDTTTTYSITDVKSRAGTVKSIKSPVVLTIVTPDYKAMPMSPALQGEIVQGSDLISPQMYIEEIHGPLRSPGVGVAF